MKDQETSPEGEVDEMEVSNLSEFRVMIIKIINSMKKNIETTKKWASEK